MNFREEFQSVSEQLAQIVGGMNTNKVIEDRLKKLRSNMVNTEDRIEDLLIQLEKEKKDVDKLQSMSFTNLFHTLINDKTEKLNQEEVEVLEVKAKIDMLKSQLAFQQNKLTELESNFKNPAQLLSQYDKVFDEKAKLVKAFRPDKGAEIEAKEKEIAEIGLEEIEVNEAIDAGQKALSFLDKIMSSLKSAENWGTYDIIGGGLLATMAKKGHLDDAQSQMHEFQNQLRNFNNELKDVGSSIDFNIQVSDFLSFADWFFDGFFVDLAVQSKITDAEGQMKQLKSKIEHILSKLESRKSELEQMKNSLFEAITRIVEKA